jgi:hypothetical protein
MKIVNLCTKGCCPVVKITDEHVEIGEKQHLCPHQKAVGDP